LTVNYGVRLDVINPQMINRAGDGGFLDLTTGEIRVAGVGGTSLSGNVENSLNFARRLSVAYKVTDEWPLLSPRRRLRAGAARRTAPADARRL
jgi:hypothetical protein